MNFEFFVSFGPKPATTDHYDTCHSGNIVSFQPSAKQKVHDTITVCLRSVFPCRVAVSFSFSKKKRGVGKKLDPFRKEEVERIRAAYNEIKGALAERRQRLAPRVNHVQNNITHRTTRPGPEAWTREKAARSMVRQQKQTEVAQKAQTHTFNKIRKALVDSYAHDLRVYREDIEFRKHYHNHLRLAVSGFWLHALAFVEVCAEMKERVFQERYKLLKQNLKKSKQAFASRQVREVIARFRAAQPRRDVYKAQDALQVCVRLLDVDRVEREARAVIRADLLGRALVENLRRRDLAVQYSRKSRRA
jgi:hypothetical protein